MIKTFDQYLLKIRQRRKTIGDLKRDKDYTDEVEISFNDWQTEDIQCLVMDTFAILFIRNPALAMRTAMLAQKEFQKYLDEDMVEEYIKRRIS